VNGEGEDNVNTISPCLNLQVGVCKFFVYPFKNGPGFRFQIFSFYSHQAKLAKKNQGVIFAIKLSTSSVNFS
tara:strand:- start:991 stop:1206 length:216 start_codon:yes stop_codon:yes gene_type:complete